MEQDKVNQLIAALVDNASKFTCTVHNSNMIVPDYKEVVGKAQIRMFGCCGEYLQMIKPGAEEIVVSFGLSLDCLS